MHQLASKWTHPAFLYLANAADQSALADLPLNGALAELIKVALEKLPVPTCYAAHIQCGDTILGFEAITHAYYSVDFPLSREAAPVRR